MYYQDIKLEDIIGGDSDRLGTYSESSPLFSNFHGLSDQPD